jgi:hypothetical protein
LISFEKGEAIMADDPNKRRPEDARLISTNQTHEVQYWSQKFGISEEQLKEAVRTAGPMVEDVRRHLSK